MIYEWDPSKDLANQSKHGMAFEVIHRFEWDTAKIARSDRRGEVRYAAIGYIGSRLHLVALARRGENIRILSIRPASRQERREYAQC